MAATKQDYDDAIAALKEGSGVSDEARAIAQEIRAEYEAANAETSRIVSQLNPDLPAAPQILATAPATTHPDGDQAAADEWVRTPGSAPKGTIMVYEPPLILLDSRPAFELVARELPELRARAIGAVERERVIPAGAVPARRHPAGVGQRLEKADVHAADLRRQRVRAGAGTRRLRSGARGRGRRTEKEEEHHHHGSDRSPREGTIT